MITPDGCAVDFYALMPAFTNRLDEDVLVAALATAGLRLDRYLTGDHSWFRAVPASLAADRTAS